MLFARSEFVSKCSCRLQQNRRSEYVQTMFAEIIYGLRARHNDVTPLQYQEIPWNTLAAFSFNTKKKISYSTEASKVHFAFVCKGSAGLFVLSSNAFFLRRTGATTKYQRCLGLDKRYNSRLRSLALAQPTKKFPLKSLHPLNDQLSKIYTCDCELMSFWFPHS